ncbi:hypothetical protein UlMin_010334 [Ulmus minor]
MAALSSFYLIILFLLGTITAEGATSTWCVARSDASNQALQTALDYACGAGADCIPLQANGLCFLPNTLQAHASYAFNSFYQKKAMAPGSCDFSGTSTIAQTDPSYGSCVYPSSVSTAGGSTPTTISSNNPNSPTTTTPVGNGGTGGMTPGFTPMIPDTDNSKASSDLMIPTFSMTISILLVLSFTLTPMLATL